MCGIVGAASTRNVVPILIDGIRRLEYRGYDSSGVAVIEDGAPPRLERLVSTARVADLASQAEARHLAGGTGISHTRWATHGAPTPANAHPHVSVAKSRSSTTASSRTTRRCASGSRAGLRVRHADRYRGHRAPRPRALARRGRAVTCCARYRGRSREFHGAYAIAVISTREPGRVVGARQGSPLVVGHRRRRSLPRLRCRGAPLGDAARRLSRGRRCRRHRSRGLRDP